MAIIYRSNTYTGTRILVFHAGSNAGHTGLVLAVSGYIPDFEKKMKIGR